MPQPRPSAATASRRWGAQPLADLVAPSLGPVLARQGFGEADVLMHWPEIVGTNLAAHCLPIKLQWRSRTAPESEAGRTAPATLLVRVEGAFALALQHSAPVIVERVNTHLGWACVGKLALRQGPLPRPARAITPAPAVAPSAQRRAAQSTAAIGDDALRAALTRLGSRVFDRDRKTGGVIGEK